MSGIELPSGDMKKSVYDIDVDGIVDNSEKLEGSTKTEVQDHTPKAHTLASHSTKAHNELTDVGVNDHHNRLHAMDDVLDHSGIITDTQHGTKTTIPNAHHTKPTITQTKSLAIGNNTPQSMGLILPTTPAGWDLNVVGQEAGISITDLDLADRVSANANGVFLHVRHTFSAGTGVAGLKVRKRNGTAYGECILYANSNIPAMTFFPYVELTTVGAQKLIQYEFIVNGTVTCNLNIAVMGYTEPLVAHNHTVTPEPHDHNI